VAWLRHDGRLGAGRPGGRSGDRPVGLGRWLRQRLPGRRRRGGPRRRRNQNVPSYARAGGNPPGSGRGTGQSAVSSLTGRSGARPGLADRPGSAIWHDRLAVRGLTLISLQLDRLRRQEATSSRMAQRAREAQASRFHPRRHARSSLQSQPPGSRSARLGRRTHGAPQQTCNV